MNKISVKINKYNPQSIAVDHGDLNARIFKYILYTFGVLSLLYVLILGNMILNIIERKSVEASAVNLTNEISELELAYLSKGASIDLEYAYSLGFKDTKAHYALRQNGDIVKLAKNDR